MLVAVVGALVAALAFAAWVGAWRQQRAVSALADRLVQAATADPPPAASDVSNDLPAPVARYLRLALPKRPSIRFVRIEQAGELRTDAGSDRWMPFTAEHLAAPRAVGFLWNARVTVAPLLHVRVRDAYIDGEGSGQVGLMSAFTVAAESGTPEMNSGSLHRFLAEAVWYPTALEPSSKLSWNPIDANRALATLTDRGVSVSLEFRFADTGEVTGISTPARWGTFDGGYAQRPWEGHFRNYEARDGIVVPMEGDVGWYVDDEWHAVWRGTVTEFEARIDE